MRSDEALRRLIKTYGIRRAVMLYGAASVAAVRGWDVMVGDDAYSRQGVWTWKRDLDAAGIDPTTIEFGGWERKFNADMGEGLALAKENIRKKNAAKAARSMRGRAST